MTGSIVIQDTVNNNLTPNGYPNTQILGISVYSFEYISLFIILFGVFLFYWRTKHNGFKKVKIEVKKFQNKNLKK
jgi:uncharacterized membrane protein